MGLDMYLYFKEHEYTSSFRKPGERLYPQELRDFEEEISQRNFTSLTKDTYYQIGYWRKFNALHSWIVEWCANGEDNCQKITLERKNVRKIINTCEKVLKEHSSAKELLPTQDGFFFGSLEYDEWYYRDVEYTIHIMKKALAKIEEDDTLELVYQASW